MKICMLLISLLFLSANASAGIVGLNPVSNLDNLKIGDTFTLGVSGSGFESDIGISGGAFKLQFDESILKLNSVTINSTVWNFGNGLNSIGDYAFGSIAFGNEPKGSFDIGAISFTALNNGLTNVALLVPTSDWGANDSRFPTGVYPKDQIQFGSLPVSVGPVPSVPVPAAFWLFGTGMVALGRNLKRNSKH